MVRTFTVFIEQDEDGIYVGRVPELKGCLSQGDTIDELMKNILSFREAGLFLLIIIIAAGIPVP